MVEAGSSIGGRRLTSRVVLVLMIVTFDVVALGVIVDGNTVYSSPKPRKYAIYHLLLPYILRMGLDSLQRRIETYIAPVWSTAVTALNPWRRPIHTTRRDKPVH